MNSAQEEVSTLKKNAKKDIEQERQEALSNVKNDVAALSVEIASKDHSKRIEC